LALVTAGQTLRAEGHCMFPMRGETTVFAIDAKTGKAKDVAKLMLNSAFGRPAVQKGVMYAGESDNLLALDVATGKHLWAAPGSSGLLVPADDALFVGGRVRALDPKTGDTRWTAGTARGSWDVLLAG